MINDLFINIKERMNKAIEHYRYEVSTIRTGRASTNILDGEHSTKRTYLHKKKQFTASQRSLQMLSV